MSHFTVLVAANDAKDLEKKLAPYFEQYGPEDSDAYSNGWIEFTDCTDEVQEDWDSPSYSAVRLADGTLKFKFDNEFRLPIDVNRTGDDYKYPEGSEFVDIRPSEVYESMEEYALDYHGYTRNQFDDSDNNRLGYWRNPNAKWDWWQIGGRWNGLLILKSGNGRPKSARHGTASLLDNNPEYSDERADTALSKDIDWSGMQEETIRQYTEKWNRWHECINEVEAYDFKTVDSIAEEMAKVYNSQEKEKPLKTRTKEELLNDTMDNYRDDNRRGNIIREIWPTELDFTKWKFVELLARIKFNMWSPMAWEDLKQIMLPFDVYLKRYQVHAQTFAFVTEEGKWIERGNMGWWGIVHEEDNSGDYDKEWWNFVESLEPDQRVYNVDCHI